MFGFFILAGGVSIIVFLIWIQYYIFPPKAKLVCDLWDLVEKDTGKKMQENIDYSNILGFHR